jgi:hypothetical protein
MFLLALAASAAGFWPLIGGCFEPPKLLVFE